MRLRATASPSRIEASRSPGWQVAELAGATAIASILHGLTLELDVCDREVPGDIRYEAERLDVLFFSGYDPYFEGPESPGL